VVKGVHQQNWATMSFTVKYPQTYHFTSLQPWLPVKRVMLDLRPIVKVTAATGGEFDSKTNLAKINAGKTQVCDILNVSHK
jgi:hypothetical protein